MLSLMFHSRQRPPVRPLVWLAILPGFVFGQFHNLATTDDGGLLYFSSTLQMQGSGQFGSEKVFVIDAGGVHLYAQREFCCVSPMGGSMLSNYFQLGGTEVSGDGSVVAVIAARSCLIIGSTCTIGTSKMQSEIGGLPGQGTVNLVGQIRMSRNGRYAFLCCDGSYLGYASLRDLNSGAEKDLSLPEPSLAARRMVSSTGMAVLPTQAPSLLVATLTGSRNLPTAAPTMRSVVDDNGLVAIYQGQFADGSLLLARVDLQTGAESSLIRAGDLSLIGATNDGQLAAFLSDVNLTSADTGGLQQLFSIRADGTGLRQVTADPAGLVEAVLAGNGGVAFAVTAAGRILKIDMATGAVSQLIGRTVKMSSGTSYPPVAGSALCLNGTGLADSAYAASPPLPSSLGGLQLLWDGAPVPLQSVSPTQACFQVPCTASQGFHSVVAATNSDPTFEGGSRAGLQIDFDSIANFQFLGPEYHVGTASQPYALAAHQDFSGLVTRANPARPGEVVHFYMTGLGPVHPPVPDGSPAPSSPPAAVTTTLVCGFSDFRGGSVPARVFFAGLAPGFVGYYQVSVLVPKQTPMQYFEARITCTAGSSIPESAYIPIIQERCAVPHLLWDGGQVARPCLDTRRWVGGTQ